MNTLLDGEPGRLCHPLTGPSWAVPRLPGGLEAEESLRRREELPDVVLSEVRIDRRFPPSLCLQIVRGEEKDLCVRSRGLQLRSGRKPDHLPLKIVVKDDQTGVRLAGKLNAGLDGGGLARHLEPRIHADGDADQQPIVGVVLHHHEVVPTGGHTRASCFGSRTPKVEPLGRFVSYHASPLLACASPLTMERPRPDPFSVSVRDPSVSARANLWNSLGANSWGMPFPRSRTASSTH